MSVLLRTLNATRIIQQIKRVFVALARVTSLPSPLLCPLSNLATDKINSLKERHRLLIYLG